MSFLSCTFILSLSPSLQLIFSFLFNDTATTEIYTLSLHDALPIFFGSYETPASPTISLITPSNGRALRYWRSEEHTSELQLRSDLVCRLLLEKKKKISLILFLLKKKKKNKEKNPKNKKI